MTQEEKDLVIKDLSARLLYKVKFSFNLWDEEKQEEVNTVCTMFSVNTDGYCEALEESGHIPLEFVKPYLRPMSSMTKSERKEFDDLSKFDEDVWMGNHKVGFPKQARIMSKCVDWLNRKMFDHRGLIPKGLALEAPEGMYNN